MNNPPPPNMTPQGITVQAEKEREAWTVKGFQRHEKGGSHCLEYEGWLNMRGSPQPLRGCESSGQAGPEQGHNDYTAGRSTNLPHCRGQYGNNQPKQIQIVYYSQHGRGCEPHVPIRSTGAPASGALLSQQGLILTTQGSTSLPRKPPIL